jgi:adenylylsulfate kinase
MEDATCYWITGLPAAGKTTLAKALKLLLEQNKISTALLDGDELRKGLCADLGLSDADRSENIRRAGEVARIMVDAGLTVVCAFVSPFEKDRQRVRGLFAPGHFAEVYLSTSIQECARRDPKKLYARAREGELIGLTGWDSPYEVPANPDFTFDTEQFSADQMAVVLVQTQRISVGN